MLSIRRQRRGLGLYVQVALQQGRELAGAADGTGAAEVAGMKADEQALPILAQRFDGDEALGGGDRAAAIAGGIALAGKILEGERRQGGNPMPLAARPFTEVVDVEIEGRHELAAIKRRGLGKAALGDQRGKAVDVDRLRFDGEGDGGALDDQEVRTKLPQGDDALAKVMAGITVGDVAPEEVGQAFAVDALARMHRQKGKQSPRLARRNHERCPFVPAPAQTENVPRRRHSVTTGPMDT